MEYKEYLEFIKNSTQDSNYLVREKAWAGLDAAYYHWPLIRKVLNTDFYKSMAKQMLKDPSLIKEDKLGAFTLKTDNGAPIRKNIFSF